MDLDKIEIPECEIYSSIITLHDEHHKTIADALQVVEKYLVKSKRILVGGLAIDYALRLKGDKIYDDDILPDYDFISDSFHADAYTLSEELNRLGFTNISCINAMHPSTMKVRVFYNTVADITYNPKNIYKKIEYLEYQNRRFIHPWLQYIDQHRSLSYPFENEPFSVIFNRWEKDMKRHDLLYKYYPFEPEEYLDEKCASANIPMKIVKVDVEKLKNQCVGGIVALFMWHMQAEKLGFEKKLPKCIGYADVISESEGITVHIPQHWLFSIFSDNLWEILDKSEAKWYNAILDKIPRKCIQGDLELIDNYGNMLSAHKFWNNTYFTNLQNIMQYSLVNYIFGDHTDETPKYLYCYMYNVARQIVTWAQNQKGKEFGMFLPSVEVYGNANFTDNILLQKKKFLIDIREIKPSKIISQPKHLYPEKNKKVDPIIYSFDPEKSDIYKFDGKQTQKFSPAEGLDI